MAHDSRPVLQIGHSPDPDDAFMWWPLGTKDHAPKIDTGRFRFVPVLADIESLNKRSLSGELEITAMSCAQYPFVQDLYALTACGSSMGDGFGPKLVAGRAMSPAELRGKVIAIPGEKTSAFAALSLMLGKGTFDYEVVAFEEIIEAVLRGRFEAGLVIHEGQLTFERAGLHLVADLGQWWRDRYGLALPLGVNAVRRDLEERFGPDTLKEVTGILLQSVQHALANRQEGLEFAMKFGRGIAPGLADRFIGMYVNHWTLDFGIEGHRAVQTFLQEIHREGLSPCTPNVDLIAAASG